MNIKPDLNADAQCGPLGQINLQVAARQSTQSPVAEGPASRPGPFGVVALLMVALAAWFSPTGARGEDPLPEVRDHRLQLEVLVEAPDLVTPTGIAVDRKGRIFVVESHTHFPPEDYSGPKVDRIRLVTDDDGDGKPSKITTFFEGGRATMNVAVDRRGRVFVATRGDITRLEDTNGDGVADQQVPLLSLTTKANYPHNGLSGFVVNDFLGKLIFGFGENEGLEYELMGSDGKSVKGGGEGGSIFACDFDGRGLYRICTGFWNPFHVSQDSLGRIYAVDNDPDSRPPCRLLDIVQGGDYGYRYRNGRKGLHPFTAWNGEIPGTLPMLAGTGEAPSGVLPYESDALPEEYFGNLLVTSWGDHRIDRFALVRRGASYSATARPIVQGGENFRPVGIATLPDGSVVFSDWVDKSYTLHGKGRLWRLAPKSRKSRTVNPDPGDRLLALDRTIREEAAHQLLEKEPEGIQVLQRVAESLERTAIRGTAITALATRTDAFRALQPKLIADPSPEIQTLFFELAPDDLLQNQFAGPATKSRVRAAVLRRWQYSAENKDLVPLLIDAIQSGDPFLHEAVQWGMRQAEPGLLRQFLDSADHRHRLLGLLCLRKNPDEQLVKSYLPRFLSDEDSDVRFAAVQWVAEERLQTYRSQIEQGLLGKLQSRSLFEGSLAALELLDGKSIQEVDQAGVQLLIGKLLANPQSSDVTKRLALRSLPASSPIITIELIDTFLASPDVGLRLDAVRSLREIRSQDSAERLVNIATDASLPSALRAEAIIGLSPNQPQHRELLFAWIDHEDPAIRGEALRCLSGSDPNDQERQRLIAAADRFAASKELVERILDPAKAFSRPKNDDLTAWQSLLSGGADPVAGERLFFESRTARCFTCHELEGRGNRVGPDLTHVGQTMTGNSLLNSILQPSKEIAPHFTTWTIVRADGTTVTGMLVEENAAGEQTYVNEKGERFVVKPGEVEERQENRESIMPSGLANRLTVEELRDILGVLSLRRKDR